MLGKATLSSRLFSQNDFRDYFILFTIVDIVDTNTLRVRSLVTGFDTTYSDRVLHLETVCEVTVADIHHVAVV
jgi:hypothetical protein